MASARTARVAYLLTCCVVWLLAGCPIGNDVGASAGGDTDSAGGGRWLAYEPAVVSLEGTLVDSVVYGPPNYGEDTATDQKLAVTILKLAQPVSIRGDTTSELNTDSFTGITDVQLVVDAASAYQSFLGRRVLVTGTLFQAVWGHYFTDVVLAVHHMERAR